MNDGASLRPDGRFATTETVRLRKATRALRLHLDELPIDYNLEVEGDHFLAGLAFAFARQRYDCAESMLGAGFGGSVVGSIARSVFVDGLRWIWIGAQPERRRALLGALRDERSRLSQLLEQADVSVENLPRWLMPLPDIADLTGQSMSWLDAPSMPSDDELLDDFLNHPVFEPPLADGREETPFLLRTRSLLQLSGLRGSVMVLTHASHGNHLGLLSSMTEDGAIAHDLRADHEALFMHIAAAGVTATLIGSAAAMPDNWPPDVPRETYLERAIGLTSEVAKAAVPIHKLHTERRLPNQRRRRTRGSEPTVLLHPAVVQRAQDLLPDINSIEKVAEAAEAYYQTTKRMAVDPWDYGSPTLNAMLAYGGGYSLLETVMATYNQPGSGLIATFAARMLLEESARLVWRFSDADEGVFKARAKQYFDEFRSRRIRTINMLVGSGVPRSDALSIFELPNQVLPGTPVDEVARARQPLPPISSMLRDLGAGFPEPGWLEVAYSLLSQVTHSTPIGYMHTVRFPNGQLQGGEISPEMLGLALDVACLGSAHLIGISSLMLTGGSPETVRARRELLRKAAGVHAVARAVHGLD